MGGMMEELDQVDMSNGASSLIKDTQTMERETPGELERLPNLLDDTWVLASPTSQWAEMVRRVPSQTCKPNFFAIEFEAPHSRVSTEHRPRRATQRAPFAER